MKWPKLGDVINGTVELGRTSRTPNILPAVQLWIRSDLSIWKPVFPNLVLPNEVWSCNRVKCLLGRWFNTYYNMEYCRNWWHSKPPGLDLLGHLSLTEFCARASVTCWINLKRDLIFKYSICQTFIEFYVKGTLWQVTKWLHLVMNVTSFFSTMYYVTWVKSYYLLYTNTTLDLDICLK